jgi:CDP-4-dehydro-6-deoxyglucose reductase
MSEMLSLTRAARLVGVDRTALQKKIQCGEMVSFDGMVSVESLLACYPQAQLEDTAEFRRISQIKEQAFGKRVFERAMPDAEVLAARITELSKTLANSQAQVKQFNVLLTRLWEKFEEIEAHNNAEPLVTMSSLKVWIKREVASAMEPGFSNPLAIKDGILHVMTAQVTVLPSKQDFLVEGHDTLWKPPCAPVSRSSMAVAAVIAVCAKQKCCRGRSRKRVTMISSFPKRKKIRAIFCHAAIQRSAM